MGNLSTVISFLDKCKEDIMESQKVLDKLLTYFNNNFSNVNTIRGKEIDFLQSTFFTNPEKFPKSFVLAYEKKFKKAEIDFEEQVKVLKEKKNGKKKSFDKLDKSRKDFLKDFSITNTAFDSREEKYKHDINKVQSEIDKYNKQIDKLNSGLGFFLNFFKMKKIESQKEEIIEKRDKLVQTIEKKRSAWELKEKDFSKDELKLQEKWENAFTDYSILEEKINNLKKNREIFIKKAAFIKTLSLVKGNEKFLKDINGAEIKECKRCHQKNSGNKFFCKYCGKRFAADRPDLLGSLNEVSELNKVFNDIQEGISQTVSISALLKGLKKGVQTLRKSVKSVKKSQDQYPSLSTLKISVPNFSKEFAKNFEFLKKFLSKDFHDLHPLEFASKIKEFTDKNLTGEKIEKFFGAIGDELNATTKEQWK